MKILEALKFVFEDQKIKNKTELDRQVFHPNYIGGRSLFKDYSK